MIAPTLHDQATDCFARIPDEIIQFISQANIQPEMFNFGDSCYVGLAARYKFTKIHPTVTHQEIRKTTDLLEYTNFGAFHYPFTAHVYFGGSLEAWQSIYFQVVTNNASIIHECFRARVSQILPQPS